MRSVSTSYSLQICLLCAGLSGEYFIEWAQQHEVEYDCARQSLTTTVSLCPGDGARAKC